MDTSAFQRVPGDKPNGVGLPNPAPSLMAELRTMRKARPIGLARLVLTERKELSQLRPEDVLYVSKLLRTYGDKDHQNYTVARYLWALRNTPGFSSIQPWWLLFLPRGILARAMWAVGARKAKLSDFMEKHRGICDEWRRQTQSKPHLLDWRDLGKDGGYEINTNYRDAQILTNLAEPDFPGRSRIARNVVSVVSGTGASLREGGIPLPKAFTQSLPGVSGPRNIILPIEVRKEGVIRREVHRILAWDDIYVRADIVGAERLRALDEPLLDYYRTG